MIDNYEETMALIKKMEAHLPIPAQPTKRFILGMRKDGINSFTTSLIRVGYIGSYDDLVEVDAGELLAISPGNPGEYDKIEDHYLLTLKATGLLPYFWGLSKDAIDIEYITKSGEVVNINQRQVIVGDKIMSGRGVFGQTEADLGIFEKLMK